MNVTHVAPHLVDQTQYAVKAYAVASKSILAILTLVADRNVYSVPTVRGTKPVYQINALILAEEYVPPLLFAMS